MTLKIMFSSDLSSVLFLRLYRSQTIESNCVLVREICGRCFQKRLD